MACNNPLLVRYLVEFTEGCNVNAGLIPLIPTTAVKSIVKVDGLGLGQEGQIEVPDWGRKSKIADGIRSLPDLKLTFRVDGDMAVFNFFAKWYHFRADSYMDVKITLTRRDWSPIYSYVYDDAGIRDFAQEGQELASTKVGLVDVLLSPMDVLLNDAAGNLLVFQI